MKKNAEMEKAQSGEISSHPLVEFIAESAEIQVQKTRQMRNMPTHTKSTHGR